jgi:hypothetical protein
VRNELVRVLAWGAGGHAALLALLYWLINVPDSNALMLALSFALCVLAVLVAAVVEGTASAWIVAGLDFPRALRRGSRALTPFACAVTVFAACWWSARRIEAWHLLRSGEIDAWTIARFGAAYGGWLHRTIDAAAFLLRWVVGLALAWAVLASWARHGLRGVAGLGWLRTGLSPRTLALTAMAVVLFVALPWQAAWWRPRALPPTWVEPTFAAAKLVFVYVAVHVGWLLTILASAVAGRPAAHLNGSSASRTLE